MELIKNKTVVVTGSSSGIGLALCKLLIEKGAIVEGISRSETPIKHQNFHWTKVDVGDLGVVQGAFQSILKRRTQVDALINNAGFGKFESIDQTDVELWQEMFNVNVNGTFFCTKQLVPHFKVNGSGHFINISSVAGIHGIANGTAYCATKFAVRGFSHSLFKELRKFGIKVTCIYPGSVATPFFDEINGVEINENMINPKDLAWTLVHLLASPSNYVPLDYEVRPLL